MIVWKVVVSDGQGNVTLYRDEDLGGDLYRSWCTKIIDTLTWCEREFHTRNQQVQIELRCVRDDCVNCISVSLLVPRSMEKIPCSITQSGFVLFFFYLHGIQELQEFLNFVFLDDDFL